MRELLEFDAVVVVAAAHFLGRMMLQSQAKDGSVRLDVRLKTLHHHHHLRGDCCCSLNGSDQLMGRTHALA